MLEPYNIKHKKPMSKKEFYEYLRLEDEKELGGNIKRLKLKEMLEDEL